VEPPGRMPNGKASPLLVNLALVGYIVLEIAVSIYVIWHVTR
jgi:hypothetical protein